MSLDRLEHLAGGYPRGDTLQLFSLARERTLRGELAISELAALAARLSPEYVLDIKNDAGADILLRNALSGGNSEGELGSPRELTPEQFHEHIRNTKYRYFQFLCVDRLNKRENIGGVQLQQGQRAELTENIEQSELELQIIDKNGSTNKLLQSKIKVHMGLAWEALELTPAQGSRGLGRAILSLSAGSLLRLAGVPIPVINAAMQGANVLGSRYSNLAAMADIARENADMIDALDVSLRSKEA